MHAHEPLRSLRHEINDHRGAFTQRDPTTKIGPLAFWEHQARVICRQPGRAIMLIKITPDALEFAHVQHRWSNSPREYSDYYFWVRQWQGQPHNCEPDKCDDMCWVSPNDLPPNTTPFVRQAIRATFDHAAPYGEYGFSN